MSGVAALLVLIVSWLQPDGCEPEVFLRVRQAPSAAERALLAEHGVSAFLVDARDEPTLAALAGSPIAIEGLLDDGRLRLEVDDFERYFDAYLQQRNATLTARPFCFHQEPAYTGLRNALSERAARIEPYRPRFVSLVSQPSWTLGHDPFDWCFCKPCLDAWRDDLAGRRGAASVAEYFGLEEMPPGEAMPWRVDDARGHNEGLRRSQANFGPWVDHRAFLDRLFASELTDLVARTRSALGVPVGFFGGAPSNPFGGHDWWRLTATADFLLPPDDPTSVEVVRSAGGCDLVVDLHRTGGREELALRKLAAHVLLGARAAIVRDSRDLLAGEPDAPQPTDLLRGIGELVATLRGPAGHALAAATPITPRIAIIYSPSSLRMDWMRRSEPDGLYWPTRTWRRGDDLLPMAGTWWGWQRLLDDIGLPYRYEREAILGGEIPGDIEVLILPRCLVLSTTAARSIESFVSRGGLLLVDGEAGLFDERGRGRARGALDGIFGIERDDSYWAGRGDLPETAALFGMQRLEPDLRTSTPVVADVGRGRAVYLNLRLADYLDVRVGRPEEVARFLTAVRAWFAQAGHPPLATVADGREAGGVRQFRFREEGGELLALVASPRDLTEPIEARAGVAKVHLTLTAPAEVEGLHGVTTAESGRVRSFVVDLPAGGFVLVRLR